MSQSIVSVLGRQESSVARGLPHVWSCGGGTQSAAIAALIIQGRLPRPDLSIIVDTGRERSSTWDYMDRVIDPAMAKIGLRIHRIRKEDYATVDMWGGADGNSLLLPAFTTQNTAPGAKPSKLKGYCSNEWKSRVSHRWLREQGIKSAIMWLGISTDEIERAKRNDGPWFTHYPLIGYPLDFGVEMRRSGCIKLVLDMGWPMPKHSACWLCPNAGDAEWRDIRDNWPKDWQKAVQADKEIRLIDPHAYLHSSGKPLETADIEDQPGLFSRECDGGVCWI